MKRSKHGLFVFPPKKTLIWRRHCSIGQSCCSMTSKRSNGWFLEVLGHEISSSERSLNQSKTTRVCIRSTNQSNRSISVRLLWYENRSNCLRPARRGLEKAKWESWLPKGQATIQVFFEPWFCHIFFTILITWPNIKLNYSCLFMLLTLIIASYLVLRCMDYCQRFQKNVMRYAATLRDWNVTLYINFGDVNLTMFFGWLSLQDVADPLFAHCRLHAVKRTSDSKVRKNTKYLTIFAKLPV